MKTVSILECAGNQDSCHAEFTVLGLELNCVSSASAHLHLNAVSRQHTKVLMNLGPLSERPVYIQLSRENRM